MGRFDDDRSGRRNGIFGRARSMNGGRRDRDFGGRGGDRGGRQMYDAVCDNCGRDCKVPFKPTGEKPVYCSDCFEDMGNVSAPRRFERESFGGNKSFNQDNKPAGVSAEQINSINAKLDKLIGMLSPIVVKLAESSGETKTPKAEKTSVAKKVTKKAEKKSAPKKTAAKKKDK
jgi:CxxC-x17-CxxC domain-containing protein